jgi:hypothetical protein
MCCLYANPGQSRARRAAVALVVESRRQWVFSPADKL